MAQAARLARIIGGFGLIALGLISFLIPILPQIPFIVAGLLLLAREYHWARRLLGWVKRKRGAASGPAGSGQ